LIFIDPFGLFACNSDGTVDNCGKPKNAAEGAAAWAQYQYEQGNKNYTKDADNRSCGGKGKWKCNCFVKEALQQGGELKSSQLPKHYDRGKKSKYFAQANELADLTKNTDVLGTGDGSVGNIVAWAAKSGSGHSGIVGCNGKIYSASQYEIIEWNNQTWFSYNQIIRYEITGREKVYRSLLND
jgi:hypothetical protein